MIILGVVPEETSEWKPEMAPQAIVINKKGEELARDDRPAAVDVLGEGRHLESRDGR